MLQSGGPTSVLNASLVGIIHEARNSFERVWGVHQGFDGLLKNRVLDLSNLDDDQLERLAMTPSAALGISRVRPSGEQLPEVLERLGSLDATALIGIGGNDTADSLARLEASAGRLQVLGLPKTIDNDLAGTDHALGYPSAARYIAAYTRDALLDARATASQYPVKFIEVMGRNAGWLAAAGALWIPPGLPRPIIAMPERPFGSKLEFLNTVERAVDAAGFVVVVVPETMRWADGAHVAGDTPEWVDAFGHRYHASAGQALLKACSQSLGRRCRVDRPGSVSRSSIDYASPLDIDEAGACGRFAVRALADGASGQCVVIDRTSSSPYRSSMRLAPLAGIANVERRIPNRMLADDERYPSSEFFDYALPLVGETTRQYEVLDWSL